MIFYFFTSTVLELKHEEILRFKILFILILDLYFNGTTSRQRHESLRNNDYGPFTLVHTLYLGFLSHEILYVLLLNPTLS